MGFLDHELGRCGRAVLGNARAVDTLALARSRHPGSKHSLDAVCTRYGIDRTHRIKHGDLLDAQLLAQVSITLHGGQQNDLRPQQAHLAETDVAPTAVSGTFILQPTERPNSEE